MLLLAAAHRVAIDAKREPRIGVPHFVHDRAGILTKSVEQ
jgi:hypothetical protein